MRWSSPWGRRTRSTGGRPGSWRGCRWPPAGSPPRRTRRSGQGHVASGSQVRPSSEIADRDVPGRRFARGAAAGPAAVLRLLLDGEDVAVLEQVRPEVLVELGVPPPQPLEDHGGVLLLLVPVVGEDLPQLRVGSRLDPLGVPVDRLELL